MNVPIVLNFGISLFSPTPHIPTKFQKNLSPEVPNSCKTNKTLNYKWRIKKKEVKRQGAYIDFIVEKLSAANSEPFFILPWTVRKILNFDPLVFFCLKYRSRSNTVQILST